MDKIKKQKRYQRLYQQLKKLLEKSNNPIANMATIVAVLHNKMEYFFWTGFYLLDNSELIVGPYQGSLACIKLKKDIGVCWEGINQQKTIIIDDVETFPGHIACDSRSKSEIVIPLKNLKGKIIGVLDVDSKVTNSFDEADADGLEKIIQLIF
ncbi:MAG: GAF domain-containing protein [Bacteroidales bacterium]|nr:GAF domain-containing protein [Bacteroidales bacterium]